MGPGLLPGVSRNHRERPLARVSGLNADRKGALRDERSKLFTHVPPIISLAYVGTRLALSWPMLARRWQRSTGGRPEVGGGGAEVDRGPVGGRGRPRM